MRVLAITDAYPPYHSGGYELRCKGVLDGLRTRGHDIRIITSRPPDGERSHNGDEHIARVFHRASSARGLMRGILDDYRDVTYLDSRMRSFRPDIVYLGHILDLTRAIFPYLAETSTPVVIDDGGITVYTAFTRRGPWYGMIGRQSNSAIRNWIKRLLGVGVSTLSHNRLKRAWSWPAHVNAYFNKRSTLEHALGEGVVLQRAQVIHSGVDTDEFVFSERQLSSEHVGILAPGRIEPGKGTKDAVILLDRVRRKDVEARLTIIGKPFIEAYYVELLEQIEVLGLQQWVTIVPQVEYHQMPDYYHSADVCFFPSYQRVGLSRVPLEAMASGCLVVTYGNEGSAEIVRHGDTGYIVPEGEIEAAAEIIRDLVASPTTLRKVIHNARLAIEQHHSMDRYVDAIEAFLLDVANQSKDVLHPESWTQPILK